MLGGGSPGSIPSPFFPALGSLHAGVLSQVWRCLNGHSGSVFASGMQICSFPLTHFLMNLHKWLSKFVGNIMFVRYFGILMQSCAAVKLNY